MWTKIIALLVITWVGYSVYEYRTGPYYDAPPTEEGDFLLAFKKGFKGVMRGFGERDQTRKYISYDASGVPSWYMQSWSICRKPTGKEDTEFRRTVDVGPGGRLDAVCEINADGEVFIRGWMVSVPDV